MKNLTTKIIQLISHGVITMKFMNVKNIIISITALLTVVSAQVSYNVSGVVTLEDQTLLSSLSQFEIVQGHLNLSEQVG